MTLAEFLGWEENVLNGQNSKNKFALEKAELIKKLKVKLSKLGGNNNEI